MEREYFYERELSPPPQQGPPVGAAANKNAGKRPRWTIGIHNILYAAANKENRVPKRYKNGFVRMLGCNYKLEITAMLVLGECVRVWRTFVRVVRSLF